MRRNRNQSNPDRSRRRAFLGFLVLALAWSSWQSLTHDCSGGFAGCRPPPQQPWADPLVLVPAALLVADLLGRRLRG